MRIFFYVTNPGSMWEEHIWAVYLFMALLSPLLSLYEPNTSAIRFEIFNSPLGDTREVTNQLS